MTTPNAVKSLRDLPGEHPTCCLAPEREKITWDGEKWVFLTEWRIGWCPFCGTRLLEPIEPIAYG